jgi:hypothetical protein
MATRRSDEPAANALSRSSITDVATGVAIAGFLASIRMIYRLVAVVPLAVPVCSLAAAHHRERFFRAV